MSDDLIARLRSPEETVFPAGTEIAVCGGTIRTLEPFSMWSSSSDKLEAADEIERLRARVEKMRAGTITLEVMLKLFAKREELLAVVRAMREEAKP